MSRTHAEVSLSGYAVIVDRKGRGAQRSGNGPPPLLAREPEPCASVPSTSSRGRTPPRRRTMSWIDKHTADKNAPSRRRPLCALSRSRRPVRARSIASRHRSSGLPTAPRARRSRSSDPTSRSDCSRCPGALSTRSRSPLTRVCRRRTVMQRSGRRFQGQKGIEVASGKAVVKDQQNTFHDQFKFFTVFLLVFAIVAPLRRHVRDLQHLLDHGRAKRTRERCCGRSVPAMPGHHGGVPRGVDDGRRQKPLIGLVLGIASATGLKALLGVLNIDIPAGETPREGSRRSGWRSSSGIVVTVLVPLILVVKAARVPPIGDARRRARTRNAAGRHHRWRAGHAVGVLNLLSGLFGGGSNAGLAVGAGAVHLRRHHDPRSADCPAGGPPHRLAAATPRRCHRSSRARTMRNPKRTASTAAALRRSASGWSARHDLRGVGHGVGQPRDRQGLPGRLHREHLGLRGNAAAPDRDRSGQGAGHQDRVRAEVRFGEDRIVGQPGGGRRPAVVDQLFGIGVFPGSLRGSSGNDGIAVYKNTAEGKHLVIGSKLAVRFAKTGTKQLTVRAIYDEQALAGKYVISFATYPRSRRSHRRASSW